MCSDWSWQQSTGQAHISLPLLLLTLQVCSDWSWQQSTGQAHISLPLLLLTLQVCSDWSWQQSTGQAHTSLPLLLLTLQVCCDWSWQQSTGLHTSRSHCCFSLCKCVLTGRGNRVLVRHTPHSQCVSLTAHHSLSAGHHSDGITAHGLWNWGLHGLFDLIWSIGDGLPMDLGRLDFRAVWLVH